MGLQEFVAFGAAEAVCYLLMMCEHGGRFAIEPQLLRWRNLTKRVACVSRTMRWLVLSVEWRNRPAGLQGIQRLFFAPKAGPAPLAPAFPGAPSREE